jgi:SAM-dependent methyltransferase
VLLRKLIDAQVYLSRRTERALPAFCHRDGHLEYNDQVVPQYLQPKTCIYDVGGGKRPYLSPDAKRALSVRVVGVDIDPEELASAPTGAYDRTITADIAKVQGDGEADLVICQAVFEHVSDVDGAMHALATILRPGGEALIFVPCRNALFARLNLLLPERVKRAALFSLYPRMSRYQGFPSYYQDCTPSGLSRLARRHRLDVIAVKTYWTSEYFYAFFPAYLVWRAWLILARICGWSDFCETFTLVLQRPK